MNRTLAALCLSLLAALPLSGEAASFEKPDTPMDYGFEYLDDGTLRICFKDSPKSTIASKCWYGGPSDRLGGFILRDTYARPDTQTSRVGYFLYLLTAYKGQTIKTANGKQAKSMSGAATFDCEAKKISIVTETAFDDYFGKGKFVDYKDFLSSGRIPEFVPAKGTPWHKAIKAFCHGYWLKNYEP